MAIILRETLANACFDLAHEVRTLAQTKPTASDEEYKALALRYASDLEKKVEIRVQQEREDTEAEQKEKWESLRLERIYNEHKYELTLTINVYLRFFEQNENGVIEIPDAAVMKEDTSMMKIRACSYCHLDDLSRMFKIASGWNSNVSQIQIVRWGALEELPKEFMFKQGETRLSNHLAQYRRSACVAAPSVLERFVRDSLELDWYELSWYKIVMTCICTLKPYTMTEILDLLSLDHGLKKSVTELRHLAYVLRFKSIPRGKVLSLISTGAVNNEHLLPILRLVYKKELECSDDEEEKEQEGDEQEKNSASSGDMGPTSTLIDAPDDGNFMRATTAPDDE